MSKFPPRKSEATLFLPQKRVIHEWSPYQKAVFKDIAKGTGHTIVIARAGSSKTSSLVEGSRYLSRAQKVLFCAFNKVIAEELKNRLPDFVSCSTLHSLGYRGVRQRFGKVDVDKFKTINIVEGLIGKEKKDLNENLCQTISLCKATLTDIPGKIEQLIIDYGIDLCELEMNKFVNFVCQALRLCKEKTVSVDFDDMVWFPFVHRIDCGKYDVIFIDEAQDMNRVMLELAISCIKPTGRIIVVCDPRQAIYSWRGADTKFLDLLRERLSRPKELPLPICYRCGTKIVALAKTIVPDIQPFEGAGEGEIINLPLADLQKTAKPGDYVLSRTNAPMIKLCMRFIKNGQAANILGRDIGDNLLYLIRKSKKKTVEALLKWIDRWEEKEKDILKEKYPSASTETISDKAECIHMLCEDTETLEEVQKNLSEMFKDGDERHLVLFSSIHRSKGKETNNVFVLADTLKTGSEEEMNLQYVAFTRAKKKLFLVHKPGKYQLYDDKAVDRTTNISP
jgi:superfamily I DNA/RNA helicase